MSFKPVGSIGGTMISLLISLVAVFSPARTQAQECHEYSRPGTRRIETSFNTESNPELLIQRVIDDSRKSIRLAAFAFSSPVIVDALRRAIDRGVDVKLVIDYEHNIEKDHSGIGRHAARGVVKAGGIVKTNSHFRIHHDKFIVSDECTVQTGSWNYASSAHENSENIIVLWNNPLVAREYLRHWTSRYNQGVFYSLD